jgi:hypothetical protein
LHTVGSCKFNDPQKSLSIILTGKIYIAIIDHGGQVDIHLIFFNGL